MRRGLLALFLAVLLAGSAAAAGNAALQTAAHPAYIRGKTPGVFAPRDPLTRAEAAAMLAALLESGDEAEAAAFPDVPEDAWFAGPVARLSARGALRGYPDGAFRPQAAVSRAEFVSLVASFFPAEDGPAAFSDVPAGHWAEEAIAAAAARGWIRGAADGGFHPDLPITRAEAVTVLNAALGRTPDAAALRQTGVRPFADVRPEDWFYGAVTEASTPHDFTVSAGGETWTGFDYPDGGLAPGLRQVGGSLWLVNKHGQITALPAGFQALDGRRYYVAADGGIPAPGAGPFLVDGDLFCRRADGALLENEDFGCLHFGPDGRYTSGDAERDAQVRQLLAGCTDAAMTRPQRLRAAYDYLRDNCKYLSRAHQPRGATDWTGESFQFWYANRKGNCYCYAAAFLYMARQLGYQALPVSGGVTERNADHAWVMIDGRLYDPEYENQQLVYGKRRVDLFGILLAAAPFPYYFPE